MKLKTVSKRQLQTSVCGYEITVYFLTIVNKDLPVKNIVFTTSIRYLWKGTDFEGVIL